MNRRTVQSTTDPTPPPPHSQFPPRQPLPPTTLTNSPVENAPFPATPPPQTPSHPASPPPNTCSSPPPHQGRKLSRQRSFLVPQCCRDFPSSRVQKGRVFALVAARRGDQEVEEGDVDGGGLGGGLEVGKALRRRGGGALRWRRWRGRWGWSGRGGRC